MLLVLRFLLICVLIFSKISSAEDNYEYLDLDISDPAEHFHKIESTNYEKYLLNDDVRSERKCVGKVKDGSKEIIGLPEYDYNYRLVKIVKVPKSGNYNPDLEELDKDDSVEATQTVDTNFETVLEVHSQSGRSFMMDRFKKNASDEYERFEYELVDVDLCKELGDTVTVNEKKYLKVDNFKTVGTVRCNEKVLLDSLNVFYRTLEVKDTQFVVKTAPRHGFYSEMSYSLDESKKYLYPNRNYREQKSLKLDQPSSFYSVLMSSCGTECLFYDGCNEKYTLVDVQEDNQYIYKNVNTYCLSVKSEEMRGQKYLTVLDLQRNSNIFLVKMFKYDGRTYVEHKRKGLDIDFTNLNEPKPVDEHSYKNFVVTEKVGSSYLTRSLDVEFKIGRVKFKNNVVLEDNENVFNREVYSSGDGLLVHDQYYNGELRKYLFRPEFEKHQDSGQIGSNGTNNSDSGGSNGSTPSNGSTEGASDGQAEPQRQVIKDLKLDYEDGVKVDLYNITIHVSAYFTDSKNNLFVKPNSLAEKLGTLSFKDFLAYPNKFFVDKQYLILGELDAKLHASTWKGFSFSESFVKVPTLKGDGDLFVCKAKDLEHFDVQKFYGSFVNKKLSDLKNFDINNLGDYYLVGVSYKKLYTSLVGNVLCGYSVFAPLDTDLLSRFLLLPKYTQSFVVIMDCDYTDCWTKFYRQISANGLYGYEIQEKEPKELDLIKVFENDRDSTKPFYSFDVFKVAKHGKVYFVRVVDELQHKIGKVLYKGKTLFEDDQGVFTRMVNVSKSKNSNGNQAGNLRVLNVERWEKSTKHYTYEIEGDDFKLTEKEKVDFELDLEPSARKNNMLNISERHEVLSYYLNWNYRDDYSLSKVTYSEYDQNTKKFSPNTLKDNLEDYPVFVRLHKHDKDKEYAVVVENHPEHSKPKNGEFFKLTTNAEKHGLLMKYNVDDKSTQVLSDFTKDLYHRRNFTSHRHHFTTSSAKQETEVDTENTEV